MISRNIYNSSCKYNTKIMYGRDGVKICTELLLLPTYTLGQTLNMTQITIKQNRIQSNIAC